MYFYGLGASIMQNQAKVAMSQKKVRYMNMMRKLKSIGGMTLAELMAVAVVIGIATSLAAPSFDRAMQRIKFRGETKNILSVLRTARSDAIAEKAPYGVHFNETDFVITLFKDINNPGNFSYEPGADSVIRADSIYDEIVYLYSSFPNSAVIFQPNGSASGTGDIFMMSQDADAINLTHINVLASTGRSKVEYIHNY
jgi:Tfp pilus assembly protein FimT